VVDSGYKWIPYRPLPSRPIVRAAVISRGRETREESARARARLRPEIVGLALRPIAASARGTLEFLEFLSSIARQREARRSRSWRSTDLRAKLESPELLGEE